MVQREATAGATAGPSAWRLTKCCEPFVHDDNAFEVLFEIETISSKASSLGGARGISQGILWLQLDHGLDIALRRCTLCKFENAALLTQTLLSRLAMLSMRHTHAIVVA